MVLLQELPLVPFGWRQGVINFHCFRSLQYSGHTYLLLASQWSSEMLPSCCRESKNSERLRNLPEDTQPGSGSRKLQILCMELQEGDSLTKGLTFDPWLFLGSSLKVLGCPLFTWGLEPHQVVYAISVIYARIQAMGDAGVTCRRGWRLRSATWAANVSMWPTPGKILKTPSL